MAKNSKDTVSKIYLSHPVRFAEICNNTFFEGNPVIRPENLRELDTKEAKIFGFRPEEQKGFWKDRDILKLYQGQMLFLFLGIENQEEIHYCMPLRCLLYDTLNYERQRSRIQAEHREKKDLKGSEYLSGFSKTDRLIPVMTLVIYYGKHPWDAPKNLHDLLDIPAELAQYKDKLFNYQLHLLNIRSMNNLEQYHGELKAFFGFLKYQWNQAELRQFFSENEALFSHISPESIQAMAILGNSRELERLLPEEGELEKEEYNMCDALREWMEEERQAGMKAGGIQAIIEDNLEEGISRERILEKLQRRFSLSFEEASQYFQRFSQSI